MKLDGKSIAFLHAYPNLAGLGDQDRRDIMRRNSGCASASDDGWFKHTFEAAMAAFEIVLWDRVEAGLCKDPRNCRVCGRGLKRKCNGYGECAEGCERRKVFAWERNYWRRNITAPGMASSAQVAKLRELWALLCDYLVPGYETCDAYLFSVLCKAFPKMPDAVLQEEAIQWEKLPALAASFGIEALKDRLRYAVKDKTNHGDTEARR